MAYSIENSLLALTRRAACVAKGADALTEMGASAPA
jgi:hypothetical protein